MRGSLAHRWSKDEIALEILRLYAAREELNYGSVQANHLKLLRAAGLIETAQAGREMINTLRRSDFDRRFPGLLDVVLANRPA